MPTAMGRRANQPKSYGKVNGVKLANCPQLTYTDRMTVWIPPCSFGLRASGGPMRTAKARPFSCRNGTSARPDSKVDSVYEEINSEKVQRSKDGAGGLLPYLSTMSPAPTYANLSKVALDIANDHWNKTKRPQSTDQESEEPETTDGFDEFEDELVGKHVEKVDADSSVDTKSNKTDKGRDMKSALPPKIRWEHSEVAAREGDLLPEDLPKSGKVSPFMRAESASPQASYLRPPGDIPSKDCKSVGPPVGVDDSEVAPPTLQLGVGSDAFATLSLNKLHCLWNEHAANMDANGKSFVQRLEDRHGQALMDIAAVKVFDLKPLLTIVQGFCDNLRTMFVEKIRKARQLEDGFAYTSYKLASDSFAKAMQQEITIRDTIYRKKVRDLETKHTDTIEKARSTAVHERMRALEAQKTVLERRLEAEMTDLKTKFEIERNEALNQVARMEQKLELISTECDSLKANHKAIKDELQSNQRWQIKFEKERSKCLTLRNEMEGMSRHQETKFNQLMQQYEADIKQRDSVVDRSKETIIRLEMQLRGEKQLRAREVQAARAAQQPPPTHATESPTQQNDDQPGANDNQAAPQATSRNRRNSFMMDTQRSMARRVTLTRKTSRNSSLGASSVNSVRLSLEEAELGCAPIALAAARSPSVLSTRSAVTGSGTPEKQSLEEAMAATAAAIQPNLPVLAEDRLNECVMVSPKAVATRVPSFERGRTSRRSSFREHSDSGGGGDQLSIEPVVEEKQS